MLRSIIISPDRELGSYLHRVLADTGEVSIVRMVDRYPDAVELSRILRSHGPHVAFVTLDSAAHATRIAAHIEQLMPGMQIVAVGRSADPHALIEVMRAGIREFLASPLERQCVLECAGRLKENLSRRPVSMKQSELLYSFLPAKPGCGASTLAVNSALALTRQDDTSGLLMDFDLNSGMVRFLLNLNSTFSILDAAEHAATMD
jgi:pilus assembly protein CpaE